MSCNTVNDLHPFQSTRDIDGARGDRETVQDIAYDGETFGRKPLPKRPTRLIVVRIVS